MKTALKVILYVIGFPLLLALVIVSSLTVLKEGATYSFWPYIGIAVTALFGIVYFITALVTGKQSRKATSVKKVRKATAALILVGFFFTSGIWLVLDQALPPILKDATDGTILFKDLQDDYEETSKYHGLLLRKFIDMNYANGNLSSKTLEEYQAEGWGNEEVKELIKVNHTSLREDGYETFTGPWVNFAIDERMTLSGIVHLIVNKREAADLKFIFKGEGREEAGNTEGPINWTIMDMQEGVMEFDISSLIQDGTVGLVVSLMESYLPDILAALNEAIADPAVAGSYIYIGLDLDTGMVTVTPSSESRGVWDYMHNAWFESNHILFAVISLFYVRHLFFIFGGVLVITGLLIGLIREKEYAKNFIPEEAPAASPEDKGGKPAGDKRVSPYLKAFSTAMDEVKSRRGYY